MEKGERERGWERIPSRFPTVSTEPVTGLDPMNHEIMTWAKINNWTLTWLSHPGVLIYHWCYNTLTTWLRSCLSSFFITKLLYPHFTPFHTVFFEKEITMHSTCLRNGELCSSSLRAECLHKLFRFLLHGTFAYILCLLMYSVTFIFYGLKDIYFTF